MDLLRIWSSKIPQVVGLGGTYLGFQSSIANFSDYLTSTKYVGLLCALPTPQTFLTVGLNWGFWLVRLATADLATCSFPLSVQIIFHCKWSHTSFQVR